MLPLSSFVAVWGIVYGALCYLFMGRTRARLQNLMQFCPQPHNADIKNLGNLTLYINHRDGSLRLASYQKAWCRVRTVLKYSSYVICRKDGKGLLLVRTDSPQIKHKEFLEKRWNEVCGLFDMCSHPVGMVQVSVCIRQFVCICMSVHTICMFTHKNLVMRLLCRST